MVAGGDALSNLKNVPFVKGILQKLGKEGVQSLEEDIQSSTARTPLHQEEHYYVSSFRLQDEFVHIVGVELFSSNWQQPPSPEMDMIKIDVAIKRAHFPSQLAFLHCSVSQTRERYSYAMTGIIDASGKRAKLNCDGGDSFGQSDIPTAITAERIMASVRKLFQLEIPK